MKKVLINLAVALTILVFLWITISFIDINLHNNPHSESTGQFLSWNVFTLFF